MRKGEWSLDYLLDLDGEEIVYEGGYTARFRVTKTSASPEKPHGISYALTFHDPTGRRLIGFDNAHGIPGKRRKDARTSAAHDHWHRDASDQGRSYRFVSAETLIDDFFSEIERVLKERRIW